MFPIHASESSGGEELQNRALRLRRVAVIGDAYYEEVFAGMAAYARRNGWDLDTCMFQNPGVLPKQESWMGVLATVFRESTSAWLLETQCPVVELLTHKYTHYPRVVCDYDAIGRCGALHFLELGAVNFGYYGIFSDAPELPEMRSGFANVIESHGFSVSYFDLGLSIRSYKRTKSTRTERVRWLKQQLADVSLPIALITEGDRFTVDICCAASELGLRVPEDVAILGVDDQRLVLESVPIEISSIDCHHYQIGWRSAELLDRMIHGAKPGSSEVPMVTSIAPKGVVVRHSTATFACEHPGVTAAALLVRRHFRERITVADVAAKVGMSSRELQREYPRYVGQGIKEDILKHRLRAAQSLLERTNLKLAAVAAETGLGSAEYLCRVFQRRHGMTPNDWRCQHGRRGIRESLDPPPKGAR